MDTKHLFTLISSPPIYQYISLNFYMYILTSCCFKIVQIRKEGSLNKSKKDKGGQMFIYFSVTSMYLRHSITGLFICL